MRTITFHNSCISILLILLSLVSQQMLAQTTVGFTNKVEFSQTGNMQRIRLVVLMPVPVTNEYQEISSFEANCGSVYEANGTNKVLFFDGAFTETNKDVSESFLYKTKKVKIDFTNTSNKNIYKEVDLDEYLESDGQYIDLNNSTIKQIGDKLWAESQGKLDYAKRCYEYVASNFKYIYGNGWRILEEIVRIGGGECGEFSTLFINLMRYKGIPARHNMGVWIDGDYHVWPDFYHEDYGWVPVDPTFKNSNPQGDYFGRYDGNLVILSQGLTTFSENDIDHVQKPLQSFCYWYWYYGGSGNINATHITNKNGLNHIGQTKTEEISNSVFNLQGIKIGNLSHGNNIVNGRKVIVK